MGLLDEKTRGRKSRDSVSLRGVKRAHDAEAVRSYVTVLNFRESGAEWQSLACSNSKR
jgi:hypothetical protein